MHDFSSLKDIIHQSMCVKTLKNNVMERKHQHFLNVVFFRFNLSSLYLFDDLPLTIQLSLIISHQHLF